MKDLGEWTYLESKYSSRPVAMELGVGIATASKLVSSVSRDNATTRLADASQRGMQCSATGHAPRARRALSSEPTGDHVQPSKLAANQSVASSLSAASRVNALANPAAPSTSPRLFPCRRHPVASHCRGDFTVSAARNDPRRPAPAQVAVSRSWYWKNCVSWVLTREIMVCST